MKNLTVVVAAVLFGAWGSIATAGTIVSSQVVLSRVAMNGGNTPMNAILWTAGGWGNNYTGSSCATVNVLTFDMTTDLGKALWATALSAFAQQKSVIAYSSDSMCLSVTGQAPIVTRLDVLN